MKRRFKEFRRTPRSRVRSKPKQTLQTESSSTSEDQVSYARDINALKAECKKIKGNHAVLSDLMKLTFAGRRKTILTSNKHVVEILEEFPALHIFDQVSNREV